MQNKEVMVTDKRSDVNEEVEPGHTHSGNSAADLNRQIVTDSAEVTELTNVSQIVEDLDNGKDLAPELNDESVEIFGSEGNYVKKVSETGTHEKEGINDTPVVGSETDDKCINEELSGENDLLDKNLSNITEGMNEPQMKNIAEFIEDCEHKETEIEQSCVVDKGNETAVLGNESSTTSTENIADDGLMIIDVRSLTDDSATDTFKNINEDAVMESKSNHSSDMEPHEKTDADSGKHHNTNEEDSEVTETSESNTESKRKRKSPNTVRRVADKISSGKCVVNNNTKEQLPIITAPQPTLPDGNTPVQVNENSGTDLEKGSDTCSGVASSCLYSESLSSTVSDATSTESESLPVISNTFSISDFPTAVPRIKSEPLDDKMYGVMESNASQNNHTVSLATSQPAAVSLLTGAIHKGQIVSQVKPVTKAQKLVMSKVPQIIYPPSVSMSVVSSAPSTVGSGSVTHSLSVNRVQAMPRSRISSELCAAALRSLKPKPKTANAVSEQNGNAPTVDGTLELLAKTQGKDKAKEITLSSKKLSTINIHSVGVAKITDLIARKNPIPTYKPVPVPPELKEGAKIQIHPCYECGDSFHFEKSLKHHLSRCSMKIHYKCEKCQKTIMFRNKCQLLNHLRSHLNIKKTQAVPIHIKSDSIEIETNFNDIVPNKPFEWYKESDTSGLSTEGAADGKLHCLECLKQFTDLKQLQDHMMGDNSEQFYCSECPLYLNTKCGLQAHQKLHKITEIKLRKSPVTTEQWNLLKSLSCPECGKHFWKGLGSGNLGGFFNTVTMHLKNLCFHFSRLPAFTCSKCVKSFQSFEGMRNHLNTSLEHYYKCGMCPMALKSLKSLDSHNAQKHKTVDNSNEPVGFKAKIIYRCHVCDTLIDDRSFLVQHTQKHLEEFKKCPQTHYHCLVCGQMFISKDELRRHYLRHKPARREYYCTFCSADKAKPLVYITHMLKCHTSTKSHLASKSVVKFCDYCGLVCVGEHMIQKHACLGMRNAPIVIGDRTEMESKNKTKSIESNELKKSRTDVEADLKYDIPSVLSSTCVSCATPFKSQSQRRSHLKDHRDHDLIFICRMCDAMNFKSYHELRSHEIACSQMKKVTQGKRSGSPENKSYSPQSKLWKSAGENGDESYVDGVQLTPKGRTGSSKRKRDVVEFFMCDKCDAVFTRKSKQEEHIKSEHGFHPCHLCGEIHESQSSLKKHLMMDHEGKRMLFYCRICRSRKTDRAFTVRTKLEKHFRLKHRMKVIDESKIITELPGLPEPSKETSPEAQKRRSSESAAPEVSVKKLKIEGESEFKCAKCLFTCNIKSEFREHILEHKAADTCQCFECGLCFAIFPSLKKHLFMVHKVRDFESYMEENNIQEPALIEDKDIEIAEPEPEIQVEMEESSEEEESSNSLECKVCYKPFDSEKALKSHMRIHGMAFIRKSRKRAKASSSEKKSGNDIVCVKSNEGGKREGLILKIKMNRLEPASTVSEVTEIVAESEPVKTNTNVAVNAIESANTSANALTECSAEIVDN